MGGEGDKGGLRADLERVEMMFCGLWWLIRSELCNLTKRTAVNAFHPDQ